MYAKKGVEECSITHKPWCVAEATANKSCAEAPTLNKIIPRVNILSHKAL